MEIILKMVELLLQNIGWTFFIAWIVAGLVLVIIEMVTPGTFYFLVLGVAAFGAGISCLIPFFPWWASFLVFAFLAIIGTLLAKRFADKVTPDSVTGANVDRFIGKRALVVETIDPVGNKGRVRVDQDEWRAISNEDTTFEKGSWVIVERVEGTCLCVKSEE